MNVIASPVCAKCGQPVAQPGLCRACSQFSPSYTQLRSYAQFEGPIRNGLHKLKYKRNVALGMVFSEYLFEAVKTTSWHIDLLVPVPLSKQRRQERGYNQSALLAKPLGMRMGLPYSSKALSRRRETTSQVGLNYEQRRENVKDAFVALKKYVAHRRVLLVDDVATSGATIEACSAALFKAGAARVYGLTLARALLKKRENVLSINGG